MSENHSSEDLKKKKSASMCDTAAFNALHSFLWQLNTLGRAIRENIMNTSVLVFSVHFQRTFHIIIPAQGACMSVKSYHRNFFEWCPSRRQMSSFYAELNKSFMDLHAPQNNINVWHALSRVNSWIWIAWIRNLEGDEWDGYITWLSAAVHPLPPFTLPKYVC